MLSYLPCGLSAERSYTQRKAHTIIFFFHLCDHEGTYFFLHKINKAYKFYKILLQKILSKKLFLELNTLRFKIEKNATEKNGVICTLSSCVI